MNEFLKQVKELFINSAVFTDVFGTDLWINFATEGTNFPFSVYTVNPIEKITKDAEQFSVEVSFCFAINKFPDCVSFYDAIVPVIEASDFMHEIFTPITDYELDLNKIIVNLKKIK